VYNDHPLEPKIVAIVDRWPLFRGYLCCKILIRDLKTVAVVDRWSLFGGVVSSGLTVFELLNVLLKFQGHQK